MAGDVYPRFCAAAVQVAPVFLDREATVARLEGWVAKARCAGADLVVFGESLVPAFPLWNMLYAPIDQHSFYRRLFDNAIEVPGPYVDQLGEIARRHGVILSVGVTEKGPISMGAMWNTTYAVWGWRIPFLIGALIAGALFLYYYFMVPESEVWRLSTKCASPLKEIFSGADLRRLAQLIVVMSGAWLTLDATVAALPGVINTVLGVKSPDVNTGILIGAAISLPVFPLIGILSQRFGRRPTIAILGLLNLFPASALYFVLVASAHHDSTKLIGLVALILVLTIPVWAVITPYLTESFRTEIRSSGYGVSYSLATVLPGMYSFYMLGLAKFMPYEFSPIVLLALGGLMLTLGALAGPETKHVDFNRQDLAAV
jgi:hypothetical protein